MKVKDLAELLKKQDQEKEVLIQQGEEFDYMAVHSVRERTVFAFESENDEELITYVVINYE